MILITTATDREYKTVSKLIEDSSLKNVTIIKTGVGKLASMVSILKEMSNKYDLIVNIGTAGSLTGHESGQIVEITQVCQWDLNYTFGMFEPPINYTGIYLNGDHYPQLSSPFYYAWCATGDMFITYDQRNIIKSLTVNQYEVCDMELYSQALIANNTKIPLLSFKVISDQVFKKGNIEEFDKFCNNLETYMKPIIDYLETLFKTEPKFGGF